MAKPFGLELFGFDKWCSNKMHSIILKKSSFSEGSEIITMYTREHGKVRGFARSIKSPKSKLAFGLQPLFYSDVDLVRTKKNFVFKGVKPLNTFKDLRENSNAV